MLFRLPIALFVFSSPCPSKSPQWGDFVHFEKHWSSTYFTLCNILNMQRYATTVTGQTCSCSDKLAKGGSQYLCLNEKLSLYNIVGQFYRTDAASLAWPLSRVGENCYENGGIQQYCILWHEKSIMKPQQTWKVNKSHSNQIALKTFGSTRIDLALNEQRRLNISVDNANGKPRYFKRPH